VSLHGSEDAVRPVPELFAGVVGQEDAVAALRAAAGNPVHAYLLLGPEGHGGPTAALGFAAALLCPNGGCGVCATCRAVVAGTDPDLHVVRRSGASLSKDTLRQVVALAQRRPLAAARQVIVVLEMHLVLERAPVLLKTLEEPPGDTVFILLADEVTPDLTTIASRSVVIPFPPVPRDVIAHRLTESGVAADLAAVVAEGSGGNVQRARVMLDDPDVAARVDLWSSVPGELGPSGTSVANLTRRVLESSERAVEPLRAAHAREIETLTEAAKEMGERGLPGRKEIMEQHQREERRFRTDALRAGLGVLARAYRTRVVRSVSEPAGVDRRNGADTPPPSDRDVQAAATAVHLITEVAESLPRNPNEALLLQSLFARLAALAA
jgi:DNA polymerase III subunit delta'